MGRLIDWHHRLQVYLDAVRGRPFGYGTNDCALFAAGAVEAMTGVDPAAGYRGRYSTRIGGLRMLRGSGFRDHAAMAAARFPEVDLGRALPGDLAVVEESGAVALGVVQGEMVYVLGEDGLGLVQRTAAIRAFSV